MSCFMPSPSPVGTHGPCVRIAPDSQHGLRVSDARAGRPYHIQMEMMRKMQGSPCKSATSASEKQGATLSLHFKAISLAAAPHGLRPRAERKVADHGKEGRRERKGVRARLPFTATRKGDRERLRKAGRSVLRLTPSRPSSGRCACKSSRRGRARGRRCARSSSRERRRRGNDG